MDTQRKILAVDDEKNILEAITAYLKNAGYEVVTAADGISARALFAVEKPDMVILDLMLPGISGWDLCKEIRSQSTVPIIMLTARSLEEDIIKGLTDGADDYLTKPFSPRELVARVRSLFRRCGLVRESADEVMSWNNGDLSIGNTGHSVWKRGQEVSVTPTEYKILRTLALNPRKIFERADLLSHVSDSSYDGFDRTIDSHIKNLRAKIEDDTATPRYIITIRGIGYRFGTDNTMDLDKK